jgi:hypothetical protein
MRPLPGFAGWLRRGRPRQAAQKVTVRPNDSYQTGRLGGVREYVPTRGRFPAATSAEPTGLASAGRLAERPAANGQRPAEHPASGASGQRSIRPRGTGCRHPQATRSQTRGETLDVLAKPYYGPID